MHNITCMLMSVKHIETMLSTNDRLLPYEQFLNQARASRRPARAWFLKIDPVQIVCMRACVSAPEAINN